MEVPTKKKPAGPPAKKRKLSDVKGTTTSRLRKQQKRDKITQEVDLTKTYDLHKGAKKRGSKIIVYGQSGMGKTTLCTLTPNPVFLAADDGIDDIMHPDTGEQMPTYKVDSYQDLRNMLAQPKLFDNFDTIVLDTMTMVEELGVQWVLDNVKNGDTYAKSLEHYGWGKGYYYLSEADNVIKHDLQRLVSAGKNVIVVCQTISTKRSEAGAEDYLKDMPKLVYRPNVKATAAMDFVEWADHVLRVGYGDLKVSKSKRVSSSGDRVVYVHPEVHFEAKSRTIPGQFPIVSFCDQNDGSIWEFIFNNAWENLMEEDGSVDS
jgi:GTPase SAR1 family protein